MSRRRGLTLALCGLVAIGAQAQFAAGADKLTNAVRSVGTVPNSGAILLVTFADRPDHATAAARLAGLGAVNESVPEVGVWELDPRQASTARGAALGRPEVVRAEWSMLRTTDTLTGPRPAPPAPLPLIAAPDPTDPFFTVTGQNQQWALRQGNWSLGLSGYDRPTIAILDSGVDSRHEEWDDPGLLVAPRSTISRTNKAEDGSDRGHGTHVAGIAAAPANGVGIVGVAPASVNPGVPGVSKVIPVQIADARGVSQDSTMIAGIRWAVNNGAKVINISSGGPGASNAFQDTINWAYRRGALVIASVGNEGLDDNLVNFPAGYDHVIGVGALCDGTVVVPECPTPYGRARFSNFNYSVDVMAPGVNIVSTVPLAIQERQVAPGYAFKDGTSMAAPYVAGVVALIYASHPGITPYQVTRILQSTSGRPATGGIYDGAVNGAPVQRRPRSSTNGWGAVNPLLAVQAQPPVDDLSEINDDVKYVRKVDTLRLTRAPQVLTARMDFNDDQFDTYAVQMRRGEKMKVTITSRQAKLGVRVYRPGTRSVLLRVSGARQLAAKLLGTTRRLTPGTRTVVVRARETGRHFIALEAAAGGDDYTLVIRKV